MSAAGNPSGGGGSGTGGGAGGMGSSQPSGESNGSRKPKRGRSWISSGIFLVMLAFLAAFLFDRCRARDSAPIPELPEADWTPQDTSPPPLVVPKPEPPPPDRIPDPDPPPTVPLPPPPTLQPAPEPPAPSAVDTVPPYIFADPWGGRHFDSVSVSLICEEGCRVFYSLEDTVNFLTYDKPVVLRNSTSLWFSGMDSASNRLPPVRVDYVIEREVAICPKGMTPFELEGREVCMDRMEWPNIEGERPRAFVSRAEAVDSCRQVGKRLCSLDEWQAACAGPEGNPYPYGKIFNEKYCAVKDSEASRSGRMPVCRSYYGTYDMTGNLWEWTSTPSEEREGLYMVAGGNWSTGPDSKCGLSRFSFYPQNRYPAVGFRCCQDLPDPSP